MNRIKVLFVKAYMSVLDPIVGLLWYSDDYKGFLHWLSIWTYEEYFRCEDILEKLGCRSIVKATVWDPDISYTWYRVPKHF